MKHNACIQIVYQMPIIIVEYELMYILRFKTFLNVDLPVQRHTYDSILKVFQKYVQCFHSIVVYRIPIIYGSRRN